LIGENIRRMIGEPQTSPAFSGSFFPASIKQNTEALRAFADAAILEAQSGGEPTLGLWKRVATLAPRFGLAQMRIAEEQTNTSHSSPDPGLVSIAMADSGSLPLRERYRIRAAFYAAMGDDQAASKEWSALLSIYPEDGIALTELAAIDLKLGNYVKATAESRLAVQANKLNAVSYLGLGRALMFAGDLSGARAACDRARVLEPGNIDITKTRAMLDLLEGNVAAAIRSLQEFPRRDSPEFESEISYWIAQAEIYGGRFKSAKSRLQQAIEKDRATGNSAAISRCMLALAQSLQCSGESDEGKKAIMAMVRERTGTAVLAGAGIILARIVDVEAASGIVADLKRQPQSSGSIRFDDLLQAELAYAAGNACEAASSFQRVKERLPAKPPLEGLARSLVACGRVNEAAAEYRSLMERKAEVLFASGLPLVTSDWVRSLFDSAKCLLAMGKNAEARQSLRSYLWILDGSDPGLSTVAEARQLLKSIR